MTDRERIDNLVVHIRSFALRLSSVEFIVSKVRQTLEASNTLDHDTFKKIYAESLKLNPQHPIVLEAERKISLATQGVAVINPQLPDY